MFFSVIIPLYNKAAYVSQAVRSVMSQSFRDFELIVVNDGSTDSSLSVARQALDANRYDDISVRIIDQKNLGVSSARNNGVSISQGDYICFLDADDWWDDSFLWEMHSLILRFPDGGIYGCSYYLVKNGRKRAASLGVGDDFICGRIDYCKVYSKTLCMPLTSISVAIPRIVYFKFNGFKQNLKLGEDFDLWIRIALTETVVFMNKPLAYYNQDVNSSTRGIGRLRPPEHHMLWNLGYLDEEEKTNPEYKQLIDNLRTYALLPYYLSKDYHDDAVTQLEKVDWSRQDEKWVSLYKKPLWYLRSRAGFLKVGSRLKTLVRKIV